MLWAIGYHQPVMHFLPTWKKKGDEAMAPSRCPRASACSRTTRARADWSWQRNPFTGTRQMKGLLVANLVLNNWDFKTSKIASTRSTRATQPARRFVVQDLGAALGKPGMADR